VSKKIQVNAELRTDVGKGASRRLRRSGDRVPGVIYGGSDEPQSLTLNTFELAKALEQEAFFSQILDVNVAGKTQQAVLRDLQRNPANERVMHIDFLRISADKALQVHVPVHFLNEEKCEGVRLGGGSLSHNLIEVEISCLPADLPEFLEVDVENLEVGSAIHLSDINLPQGVVVVALTHGDDHDLPVVACNAPRGGSEEEELEAEAAAAEAEGAEDAEGEGDAEEAPSED
jgi:large subunit ribosomal protein L25